MFIYPENLSQKPKLWLWHLKDITLIGIFGMLSIFLYMQINLVVSGAIVITYAIMTVRFDDETLDALQVYLNEKEILLDAELVDTVQKLYVPVMVRSFIERDRGKQVLTKKKSKKEDKPYEQNQ